MKERVLVVVDVQNDFIDGSLGSKEAQAAMPRIMEKVAAFDGRIFVTQDTHLSDYLQTQEGANLPVPHCEKGTKGWELPGALDRLVREKGATFYEKVTFGSTDLASDLAERFAAGQIESVEFIGFCTDICVVSNALLLKAQAPELPLMVDASCCAGVTPEKHESALDVMASCQVAITR